MFGPNNFPCAFNSIAGGDFAAAVAAGKAIYAENNLDLCQGDAAILELDRPIDMTPVALRLDAPAEIGEPALVVVFLERAGVDEEPQRRAALGLVVRHDGVTHTVRQRAETHRGVGFQVARLVGKRDGGADRDDTPETKQQEERTG